MKLKNWGSELESVRADKLQPKKEKEKEKHQQDSEESSAHPKKKRKGQEG
jgi:hypothetical protein